MTEFEATYVQNYTTPGVGSLVTAKNKIANLVDTDCLYSMRWPKDSGWIAQAKKDLRHCQKEARDRIEELKRAETLLDSIVPNE